MMIVDIGIIGIYMEIFIIIIIVVSINVSVLCC